MGVAGLVLKGRYSGPYRDVVLSYAGNATASFAVYFIVRQVSIPRSSNWLSSAVVALLVVELFEITNGFGVMANVYDPLDLVANALAIAFAAAVDVLVSYVSSHRIASE